MRARYLVPVLFLTASCDSSRFVGQVVGFGSAGTLASLTIAPSSATIAIGEALQVAATPLDASGQPLSGLGRPTFASANPLVAFVNDTGLVVAVSPGTVLVTATLSSGGVTRSAASTITVTAGGTQGRVAIDVGDNFFSPSSVIVTRSEAGAAITWNWTGARLHNVTFDDGAAGSSNQTTGTFERTFTAAGTFSYFCSIHGRSAMSGTITVR